MFLLKQELPWLLDLQSNCELEKKKQQKNGDKIFSKAVANRFMLTYTLIPKFFSAKTFSISVKYFGQIFNSKKMNFIDENKIGLSKLRI